MKELEKSISELGQIEERVRSRGPMDLTYTGSQGGLRKRGC
jgi:hypothetical protein